MILREIDMFKRNLLYIEEEMKKIYNKDVFEESVKEKLNNSLDKYISNLENTCRYLLSQDTKSLIKFLNKKR